MLGGWGCGGCVAEEPVFGPGTRSALVLIGIVAIF